MGSSHRKLRANFNLGGEQAEADPLLPLVFFESGDYAALRSRDDARCFIVARTGGGKTAALQRLEEEQEGRVIRIAPEDLSLPYITDLGATRYLSSLDVNLVPIFVSLWKHVLLVELIRHRYNVDSLTAKMNFFRNLREIVNRDPAKKAALEYLDEFAEKFWCETDERVREITDKFQQRIEIESGGKIGIPKLGDANAHGKQGEEVSTESRRELTDRFQRVVNETQLARLNKMLSVLNDDILNSRQHYTYVVIDDLDRDWVDEPLANELIVCLFRTVLDLKRVANLKVLVALRTNIFLQLDFTKLRGVQEEKYRSLVLQMRWTEDDLVEMINERVRVAAQKGALEATAITDLLPRANPTRGNPLTYILERTLMRPRDVIAFLNECFSLGTGRERLTWEDIRIAERSYSEKRLLALRDEWSSSYPGIDQVLNVFRNAPGILTKAELTEYLDEIALLPADREFRGTEWLTGLTEALWSNSSDKQNWIDWYHPLVRLLYSVGFLGCMENRKKRFVYSYEESEFADRRSNIDSVANFHIHLAFHAELDVKQAGFTR